MTGYVVWHNRRTNETQTWAMNGSRIQKRSTALDENDKAIFVGPPWRIVGTSGGHIYWHNSDTNETQIWFMNLDKIARRATVVDENGEPIFITPPWHIVGVGNINAAQELGGPHRGDIVWHNEQTQETQVWIMNDEGHGIERRVTVSRREPSAHLRRHALAYSGHLARTYCMAQRRDQRDSDMGPEGRSNCSSRDRSRRKWTSHLCRTSVAYLWYDRLQRRPTAP